MAEKGQDNKQGFFIFFIRLNCVQPFQREQRLCPPVDNKHVRVWPRSVYLLMRNKDLIFWDLNASNNRGITALNIIQTICVYERGEMRAFVWINSPYETGDDV